MSNFARPSVVFGPGNTSATVVAVNGAQVQVVAQAALSVWFRKDGGVTFRTDQEAASQTVRVDRFGRLHNTRTVERTIRFGY
jgi:hypothetical protein